MNYERHERASPARKYPDHWAIVASPGRGDKPSLISGLRGSYNNWGEPKAIHLVHLDIIPAERAGNTFAPMVRDVERRIEEDYYDNEVHVLVDRSQFSRAEEQFAAISDATFYCVKTGDRKPERRDVGRNYLLDLIRELTQKAIFDVKLPEAPRVFFEGAVREVEEKPPRIAPEDLLLTDADEKERAVLACGLGLLELHQSVGTQWLR